MPKNFIFQRMPSASVRVRGFLVFRLVALRATALILMSVMALPSMFATARVTPSGVNTAGTGASLVTPERVTPAAAPPEPFQVARTNVAATMIASIASGVTSKVTEIISTPKLPAGFEAARVPTFTDRVVSSLAMFAPTRSAIRNPKSAIVPPPPPSGTVLFDFDEDGKADIGRWQGSNTEFKVRNSSDGSYTTATIGSSSSVAAPGDFDGDGQTDAAVFAAGSWTIKKSSDGATQNTTFGTTGDRPVAADYDGDATTDIAVFRPSTGTWWIRKSSDLSTVSTAFGASSDIPVTGNWDGDAYADVAVYRPSTGYWYVTRSTAGSLAVGWGTSTDIPVPADFDGDNKTDLAVYRPSTGAWWIMKSATGFDGTHVSHTWGNYGDQPVPADYDGDNKADLAVWRPKTGVWYIAKSSANNEEFEYHSLGIAGNTAVPSAYLSQVGTAVYGDDMANARLSPKNATGGTNLYSRNFSWGTSLVGLPGRSGLDVGFGISYNSLVWTKLGTEMHFDVDQSNVSPGFRLGFPTIEPVYYNDATLKHSFLMVTPSGARVEFRNTTVSNIYETADSSYTQLKIKTGQSITTPIEEIDLEVTTTDGTMMTYEWLGGAYRCSQIKDRNGNYISIAHDEDGTLRTVTDTLGRVITVNYDSQLYPTSVTQTWKTNNGDGSNTTHTWATFTYTTKNVAANFGSLTVVGPPNSTVVKVLEKVTFADGSSTKFTHNGYVQVEKVENFAADDHLLNHVRTNLDAVSGTQSDCPRFGATYTKVDNFNLSSGVPQEIEVTNTITTGQTYSVGGISGSATRIEVTMTGHPDGLYSRTFVGESGWKEGLTLATEDCIGTNCSDRKRWSWTDWDQDDPAAGYILNPRVEETRVGDGTNTKRTTIDYDLVSGNISMWGLVAEVKVYDSNLSTVLKEVETDYNLSSTYTDRRIIGLPSEIRTYGRDASGLNLTSKVTYGYDEGSFNDSGLQQNISPTQHDNTNYGSSFVTGRGNPTSGTRWNVDYPTSSAYAITSSTKYNTAGSPVAKITPWDGTNTRTTRIGYADNFNSTVGVATYAYPTVLTDPAGSSLGDATHSSTVKYRYDIGVNVEANSPAPAGNIDGKKTKRFYDSTGRLESDEIYVNTTKHAYTRYEYPPSGIQSKVYSTIIDTDNDGADTDDEVLSETFTDGAGRVRLSRVPHTFNTNGTTATWAGTITEYDILGRVKRQSVPTEVSSSWAAAGDDATRGFLYTHQKYDWMGRVMRKINTDGTDQTSLNDSDILIAYEGCGCAGATTTTIESERVPIPGTTNFARRKQKAYTDILGRNFKTETFDWDGTTVYSSVVETYNGRDQIINTRQSGDSTYRDVTMTFDGHGRMKTRHYPIEDTGANTTWVYNPDDSIQAVTDPRGVVTSFTYNSRALMTGISYDPGSTGVADTPDVGFDYDNVGNRIEMTDGTGNTSYVYNSLSRMTSETKYITDLNDDFTINYTYGLSGSVLTYTDPQDSARKAEYAFDKTGRISEAKNTYSGATKQRLHETQYRAWGALKKHTFSTVGAASTFSIPVHFDYDDRLNVSAHYSPYEPNPSGYQHYVEYDRNADGKINLSTDTLAQSFTRNFEYDQIGRVTKSLSGKAVHNITGTDTPYRTTIAYNSFSEETSVTGKHWEATNPAFTPSVAASTGRMTTLSYDAAGNITSEPVPYVSTSRTYAFDAAGRNTSGVDPGSRALQYTQNLTTNYDGNGWRVKNQSVHSTSGLTKTTYEFSSTVLGGETVGEWSFDNNSGPEYKKFFSNANGVKMKYLSQATLYDWEWMSPEGTTKYGGFGTTANEEFDPRGGALGIDNPYSGGGGYGGGGNHGDAEFYQRCSWEGMSISCGLAFKIAAQMNHKIPRKGYVPPASGVDSPLQPPQLPPGIIRPNSKPDTSALALATTVATQKADERPDKGSPIEPSSDPSIDPESSKNREQREWTVTVQEPPIVLTTLDLKPTPFPQSRSLEMLMPQCEHLIPLDIPPGADVNANIAKAQKKLIDMQRQAEAAAEEVRMSGMVHGAAAARMVTGAVTAPGGSLDNWFYGMVKDHGPWDYKYLTPDAKLYEPFGNFNYGATGASIGYPLGVLLRMAGWVQTTEMEGEKPLTMIQARSGVGGVWPYGDQKRDSIQIEKGFNYFNCTRGR